MNLPAIIHALVQAPVPQNLVYEFLEYTFLQYCGQNSGCHFGNDAIVTKRFVIGTGFFQAMAGR
jgi:hypothetical protein